MNGGCYKLFARCNSFPVQKKWFNVYHSVKIWSAFVSYYASKQENQKKKNLMCSY